VPTAPPLPALQPLSTWTPVPTAPPAPTRTPAPPTRTPAPPTRTPAPNATLPAPVLAGPADGQVFAAGDAVVLRWNAVGSLPADGYYVVHLAYTHNGATWTDDTPWIKAIQWAVSEHDYLPNLSDDGRFRWSVRVMRQTGTDARDRPTGVALSPASAERTFIWQRAAGGEPGPGPPPTPAPPP
jgi:hypothetical protein